MTFMKSNEDTQTKNPFVGIEAKTGYYPGMAGLGGSQARSWSGGRRRILGRKGQEAHCYHLMSRTCGGETFLDEVEREALVKLIGKMARFCGVEVLTYCVMGNHFHLLARVADKDAWLERFAGVRGESALLAHLATFYSRSFMQALRAQLAADREVGDEKAAQERLERFTKRLCDVSVFMKEVKERFSKWYNRRHGRRGTLWMDRFKSVLVEDRRQKAGRRKTDEGLGGGLDALRAMALYIDLNPVRAGLVEDPAEYRWCGYSAAMGGEKEARRGLMEVTGLRSWARASAAYRMWLFATGLGEEMKGEECGMTKGEDAGVKVGRRKVGRRKVRHGVSLEKRGSVIAERGRMSLGEVLRCRVRYFSDGAVIGSREFVATYGQESVPLKGDGEVRSSLRARRRGARIGGAGSGLNLFSYRDLKVNAIGDRQQ